MLAVSDAYAASGEMIARTQSRWLAYSGWNLALEQLETDGSLTPIVRQTAGGQLTVQFTEDVDGKIAIQAKGLADGYPYAVQGQVQLKPYLWPESDSWPTVTDFADLQGPGKLLVTEATYSLAGNLVHPLLLQRECGTLLVQVTEPLTAATLYIDGDLQVEAPLQAERLLVRGTIYGSAWITCPQITCNIMPEGYQATICTRTL